MYVGVAECNVRVAEVLACVTFVEDILSGCVYASCNSIDIRKIVGL